MSRVALLPSKAKQSSHASFALDFFAKVKGDVPRAGGRRYHKWSQLKNLGTGSKPQEDHALTLHSGHPQSGLSTVSLPCLLSQPMKSLPLISFHDPPGSGLSLDSEQRQ